MRVSAPLPHDRGGSEPIGPVALATSAGTTTAEVLFRYQVIFAFSCMSREELAWLLMVPKLEVPTP